jgi:hypothetical protein
MLDLYDPEQPEFAALVNPALDPHIELLGAVRVDFDPPERTALEQYDVSVPYFEAPPDALEGQYLATQVVNFRKHADGTARFELTTVDTAHFDAERGLVVTDPSVFPGLTIGGTFGLVRTVDCVGFVSGWATTGDHFGGDAAGWIGGGFLGLLPFPIDNGQSRRFTIPVPCNEPVTITLNAADDTAIDGGCGCAAGPVPSGPVRNEPGEGCEVAQGELKALSCTLASEHRSPSLQSASVLDGASGVDPLLSLQLSFDGAVAVPEGAIVLRDESGRVVGGRVVVSGSAASFVPEIRLRYGKTYTLAVSGVVSESGDLLPGRSMTFRTFEPEIVQHIAGVDARDVAWLGPNAWPDPAAVGLSPCSDLIAVAEGDAHELDHLGGIRIYDVSGLSDEPPLLSSVRTAGVDRALRFAAGPPVAPLDRPAFSGPFLMSVDGPGGPSRFGVWRLFDLSQFPALTAVSSRLINQSQESLARIAGVDAPLAPSAPYDLGALTQLVPNDTGLPLDVAGFGTEVSYVANTPFIGLQAIVPNQMRADFLADPQVHGTLRGGREARQSAPIRAVATLGDADPSRAVVVAVAETFGQNDLLLTDPQLSAVADSFLLGGKALAIAGLRGWPSRLDPRAESTVPRDLVAAMCQAGAVCVVAVDKVRRRFDPGLISPGLSFGQGYIKTPGGSPRGMAGDRFTQLLLVADGTAGLSIVDLAIPGGRRDHDGDGIDDRVLGTVDLGGARAEQVAVYRDSTGALMAVVAAGAGGLFNIQVTPGDAPRDDGGLIITAPGADDGASLGLEPRDGEGDTEPPLPPTAEPECPAVQFDPYPDQQTQAFGFDKVGGKRLVHVSLDKAGSTQVKVTISPFDPRWRYYLINVDAAMLRVDGDEPIGGGKTQLELLQPETVLSLRGQNPETPLGKDLHDNPKHAWTLLQVKKGSLHGPDMGTLLVHLYKKRVIPLLSYYRVANSLFLGDPAAKPECGEPPPPGAPTWPEPQLDPEALKQRLNQVFKQTVLEITDIVSNQDTHAPYDLDGNGCVDVYGEPGCECDEGRLVDDAFPRSLALSSDNPRIFHVDCVRYHESCGDPDFKQLVGWAPGAPYAVVSNLGDVQRTMGHELLHLWDVGALNDLVASDNVMHFSSGSRTGDMLRYRPQPRRKGGGEDWQWNAIRRCDANSRAEFGVLCGDNIRQAGTGGN